MFAVPIRRVLPHRPIPGLAGQVSRDATGMPLHGNAARLETRVPRDWAAVLQANLYLPTAGEVFNL